jgi:hypothetical protein
MREWLCSNKQTPVCSTALSSHQQSSIIYTIVSTTIIQTPPELLKVVVHNPQSWFLRKSTMERIFRLAGKQYETVEGSRALNRRSGLQKMIDRSRLYARVAFWEAKDAVAAMAKCRRERLGSCIGRGVPHQEAETHQGENQPRNNQNVISNTIWDEHDTPDTPVDATAQTLCFRAGMAARERRQQKRVRTPPWLSKNNQSPDFTPSSSTNPPQTRRSQVDIDADVLALVIKQLEEQRGNCNLGGDQVRLVRMARQALSELPCSAGYEVLDGNEEYEEVLERRALMAFQRVRRGMRATG